jgi:hypothetical protein
MSLVIWYAMIFPELGVRVSNDVFSGEYLLDAEITIEMTAGDSADTFQAVLANLPAEVADGLKHAHQRASASKPLEAKIFLGYFDEPATATLDSPVLHGAVTSIRSAVTDGGLLTTEIKGQELAGFKLLHLQVNEDRKGKVALDDFVKKVVAPLPVSGQPGLGEVENFTLKATNGLAALQRIAERAKAPLVVTAGRIFIGKAVGTGNTAAFDAATNIVTLTHEQAGEEQPDTALKPGSGPAPTIARTVLDLTVLGDPALRVGQSATVKPRDPKDTSPGPLRIGHLTQKFSTKTGYTCEVRLVGAKPGEDAAAGLRGASALVKRFRDVTESAQASRPAVDIGQVTGYKPGATKHSVTLNYGQSPPADAVRPSVDEPVNDKPQLHDKPIGSLFAWHKCGLIVPVYEGMRAVLLHNRGLVNDAIVGGFLWVDEPALERPDSKTGDWWLCLPTELDGNKLPTGKGAHDLIDASGCRVIHAKGLHVLVGKANLADVGTRPAPPAEKTVVIEHESGTTIRIDDQGAVAITTAGKDITISAGTGTIVLKGKAVQVS